MKRNRWKEESFGSDRLEEEWVALRGTIEWASKSSEFEMDDEVGIKKIRI
jgi:hypothetical protein